MDSIGAKRNDSPLKSSNSYAISRRADNSPRRQSSTIATSSSSFGPGFSPQRTAYNTRQSLSRSYDSPEGIRRMSQVSAKKASSSLRRAASPPACSSSKKQHISASGRNQTILDDAAWMSERIHNLQKTGFLRYPSISKLRDAGEISPSPHSRSVRNKDDKEMSVLCCSSPGFFNQSSTLRHSQTVMNQTDEPLSAFRLSEVTLSEEDLLTDISSSREFSTCNSTPVLMQSSHNFDQIASEFYQGTPLSHNVGKDYQNCMQQSPNGNINHPHSAASSESTSYNMQGDLLLRLEALQYRAELAAKGGSDSFSSGQVLSWDQDTTSSNQKQSACTQQSNAASSASPTHSNLSIESISWPEEPESSLDSTCWLKAINEEAKTEPFASHVILSSSRSIRPEYYLPLSREEDPSFSSPKGGKRTELRNDNMRRLALGMCQRRSEQMGPGKSVNNHKQTSLARKSKKFLESSMDSANGYGSVKARGMAATLSPKPSPGVARRTLPTEARPSLNHLCVEYKGIARPVYEQSKSINQMKALTSEMDGQTRNSLENRFEYDGESSWISEENVEGFLCSQSFTLHEADGLSTSNEWSSERPSRNKSIKDSQMKDSGKGLFSSSRTQSACLNEEVIKGSNEIMAGICMFDRCKELPLPSQGCSTITSQTDTHLQLLKEESLADSHQAANISHQSVCQITHSGDESLNNDLLACCKDTSNNERLLKESQHDAGVKVQILCSSWSAVSPKDLNRVIEESVENNMTFQAEKKLESTHIGQCHSARYSFHSSIPLVSESGPLSLDALSSPADLVEDRYWQVIANRNENATQISTMHPQNLLEGRSSEHKVFARIVRSLSFSEQGNSALKSSSKLQRSRDISESKSTGFTHYWIPNSAYSLNSSDLENSGGKYSTKTQEKLNPQNSVEMLQITAQITKELLQEMPSQNGDIDKRPEGDEASLILLDNAYLNIDQLAYGMAHTVLLSHTTKSESHAMLDSDCKAPLSKFSQQCHDQLDRPVETQCKVQDDSRIEKVQEDINSSQQAISRVPKGGRIEADDNKGCHGQSLSLENFTRGESLCTKTLQVEPDETEPEVIFEKFTLSGQHIGIPSFTNQKNGLMTEGVDEGEMILKFPCSSGPENGRRGEIPCGRGETPSSLLSIYKNPLWRDEVNVDFENGHTPQNQEFLEHSYSDEGNFLDSDKNKNRIGFSKRSLGEVWDTYEGIGGFISSFPNSPSCTAKQASEANHIPVGFDSLINSSESTSFVLDSVWDVEGSAKKLRKIGEEVSEVPGFFTQQRLRCYSQADQCQQSAQNLETIELQTINHDASSSSPVNVKDITSTVDGNINITSISLPLSHMGGFEALSQLKRNFTIEKNILSDGARIPDGLEDCLREHSIGPYGSSSHSIKLINKNVTNQDAALVANESTNDYCLNSEPKCNTGKKTMPLTEMACKTDEAKVGREALDKLDPNGSKIRRELTVQYSGASINIERISASQYADRKLQSDPLCEQNSKECVQPPRHKLGFAKANAPDENHSTKDNAIEAGEEVKQVTIIYSDSKEPQNDLQAVEASVPEVPLDLLSTWILSFFTHASKGGGNFKRKEQKQPLIQDKKREDQAELKRIGKKVQALEAEIDRFKQENRKLQSLMKCMIRKIKQLQQGLRGRKRNGSSKGFMTCIYSVRVKSSKSKIVRKP